MRKKISVGQEAELANHQQVLGGRQVLWYFYRQLRVGGSLENKYSVDVLPKITWCGDTIEGMERFLLWWRDVTRKLRSPLEKEELADLLYTRALKSKNRAVEQCLDQYDLRKRKDPTNMEGNYNLLLSSLQSVVDEMRQRRNYENACTAQKARLKDEDITAYGAIEEQAVGQAGSGSIPQELQRSAPKKVLRANESNGPEQSSSSTAERRSDIQWKPHPSALRGREVCVKFITSGCDDGDCPHYHPARPRVCVDFQKVKGCSKGENCGFLHEAIGPVASERLYEFVKGSGKGKGAGKANVRPDGKINVQCRSFHNPEKYGPCLRGDKCRFLHGEQ